MSVLSNSQPPSEPQEIRPALSGLRFFTFSDGAVIALASAAGYIVTNSFELGYADYYGLPRELIVIDLTKAFLPIVMLGGMFAALFWFGSHMAEISSPGVYRRRKTLIGYALLLFPIWLVLVLISILLRFPYVWFNCFLGGLSISALLVLAELIQWRKNRRSGEIGFEANVNQERISGPIPEKAPMGLFVLMVIFFANSLALQVGRGMAESKKRFYVTRFPDTNEVVLLRTYGDELIFAPFDRQTKEVEKSFIIVTVTDLKTPLTLDELGPLKPVQR